MPHKTRAGPLSAVLGLVLGCLALGPALGWGFILVQDMVFVPDPAFSRFTFGRPRGAAGRAQRRRGHRARLRRPGASGPEAHPAGDLRAGLLGRRAARARPPARGRPGRRGVLRLEPVRGRAAPDGPVGAAPGLRGPSLGGARGPGPGGGLLLAVLPAAVGGFAAMAVTALRRCPSRAGGRPGGRGAAGRQPAVAGAGAAAAGRAERGSGGREVRGAGPTRRSGRWAACCCSAGSGTPSRCRPGTSARWARGQAGACSWRGSGVRAWGEVRPGRAGRGGGRRVRDRRRWG